MKKIINGNQRGLLFKNGIFVKMIKPGKHRFFGSGIEVEIYDITTEFNPGKNDLSVFLKDSEMSKELSVIDVSDERLVLHYINGKFNECLSSGNYAFWSVYDRHEFKVVDITGMEVDESIPKYLFTYIPRQYYTKFEVAEYQKGRLFIDNKFVRLLDEGTYYFWNNGSKINVGLVDTRLLQMDISGQEILTLDKVGLRLNFVCHYRIVDYMKIFNEIDDYKEQIHVTLQLALRDYIGKFRLDEILENKNQISEYAFSRLKEKEGDFYIEVIDAGVKDIILPGEIRDIMNTVILAEKKAQANVITRREEVASTRSLLNTAKLMEENQVLFKLKEMEYLERICENVGNISVDGGSNLLGQLSKIVKGD